jgi:hypothetical protein
MPLTYEQRVELLKKAREAKKNKKMAKETPPPEPEPEPDFDFEPENSRETVVTPKLARTKKVKPEVRSLDIKKPEAMPDFVDSEPEIIEEVVYKPKDKKKKKIIRKIIMEASSDEEEVEVVEEIIKVPKKVPERQAIEPKIPKTPKYMPSSKTSFFNF